MLHIFTLLFWPVLFDFTIPGAFETSFQTGPLDLVHDTFYSSRKEAIEERLRLIEEGHAEAFIIEADERERPLKTWAAGVRWDDFSLEDVLGIAEVRACLSTTNSFQSVSLTYILGSRALEVKA